MNKYEVIAYSMDDVYDQRSFFLDGRLSMLDMQRELGKKGYELDELTTLKNYLDHNWVDDNELIIMNETLIMAHPFEGLIDDYAIYDRVGRIVRRHNGDRFIEKVEIEMDTDNASFEDWEKETSKKLREIADVIESGYLPHNIVDSNGNEIGSVAYIQDI